MNNGLKQRIVGAVVLLALGVLFVPMLFESGNRRTVDRTTQIPPAPGIAMLQVAEPRRATDIEPVKPAADMYQLLPETEVDSTAAEPVTSEASVTPDRKILDDRGVPKGWAVQVASFNTEKRALVLRDQLLEDGYPAFVRTLKTSKGVMTRVYVGPKINRSKARQVKVSLDRSLKLETLVVRFSP